MNILWSALGILVLVVIVSVCIVLSLIMIYGLWTIVSFLEFLYGLFASKISTYPRSDAKPKFYLGELPKDIINGIDCVNKWFQSQKTRIQFYILRQGWRWQFTSNKVKQYQCEHRDTEYQKASKRFRMPSSHRQTLPQSKEGNQPNANNTISGNQGLDGITVRLLI